MQQEIATYFHSVANKYDILQHISFRSKITTATWDAKSATWLVTIINSKTNTETQRRCKILVSAVGALSTPRECDIPGAANYTGKMFHSATWDHNYPIKDKNVVVLGDKSFIINIDQELTKKLSS
jgi:cation diffusion facilitator CzcD-associated flavoprotein CzcO